jgi:hypothetical protein
MEQVIIKTEKGYWTGMRYNDFTWNEAEAIRLAKQHAASDADFVANYHSVAVELVDVA